MTFDTLRFCIFFMIVLGGFYLTPRAKRKYVILVASICFYLLLDVKVCMLALFTVVFTYFGTGVMEHLQQKKMVYGRCCFGIIIAVLLGILGIFKYINFASDIFYQVLRLFHFSGERKLFELFATVGMSYYTLKAVMYVVEVYQKKTESEKDLVALASYLLFFPQIIAGPIDRPKSLLVQLKGELSYREELVKKSILLLASGYMKKLVIANMVVGYVDSIYTDVSAYKGLTLLYGIFLYSIQIYCDFSGYSQISMGLAGMLGIEVGDNFNCPYLALNIKDFWGRWHISLSSFLKDYIYIPLGGNRNGRVQKIKNTLVTFLLSGLWHGANYTFLVWGLFHGVLNCMCKKTKTKVIPVKSLKDRVKLVGRISITFVCVTIGWVFFRAESLTQAVTLLARIVTTFRQSICVEGVLEMIMVYTGDMMSLSPFLMSAILVVVLLLREYRYTYGGLSEAVKETDLSKNHDIQQKREREQTIWLAFCVFAIVCFGSFGSQGFIYANF